MLRPYQEECLSAIVHNYRNGVRQQIAVLSTGTGKTVIAAHLPSRLEELPGKTLFIAHRAELVEQAAGQLKKWNPTLRVGVEMADQQADAGCDVVVACVATIGRKGSTRMDKHGWDSITKIIIDEVHHVLGTTYLKVLTDSGVLLPDSKKLLLGITATPSRGDGQSLSEIYKKIVFSYGIRQAIEEGFLVDIRGYRVRTDTDLSGVEKSKGDFVQDQLAAAVNTPERNRRIVKAWLQLGESRNTVVFCVGIQHAKDLAAEFIKQGVQADAIWGDDPDRADKLKLHREGTINVLCNCAILTEGYDDPGISCILLARPTQSATLFTQMVGRGTRLNEGKTDLVVIDVVDNSVKHSLITLPTLMGLMGSLDLKGKSLVGAIQKIEGLQEQYPSLDFKKLEDFDQIKQFIEQANFFEVRFPSEVEANSDFTWYRSASGGYRLNIPKDKGAGAGGFVRIFQNMLDQWEIDGLIDNKRFHGVGSQMENAFKVCDEQIRKRVPDVLNIISRKATWHGKKATKSQLSLLKRFYPYKQMPADLTAGAASRLIGERIARKAK